MPPRPARRWIFGIALAAVAIFFLALVFRQAVVATAVFYVSGRLSGFSVNAGSAAIGWRHAHLTALRVRSARGEPVADIAQVDADYDLGNALLGRDRLFGLRSLTLLRPHMTIIHRRDGSYNIPLQQQATPPAKAGPPLIAVVRVSGGSLVLEDDARRDPQTRRLYVDDLHADMDLNLAAHSRYTLSLAYREDGRRYPIRGSGTIDRQTGFMLQKVTASLIPVARLMNYAADSPQVHVRSGVLRNIDARYIGLAAPGEALAPVLAAHGDLQGVAIYDTLLARPLRDLGGRVDVYGNGLVARAMHARLGAMLLHISGGAYNFAHPQLRAAITGSAGAADLRAVAPQSAHLPVEGPLAVAIAVEGEASRPVAFVSVRSALVSYNRYPLHDLSTLLAADADQGDIIDLHGRYQSIAIAGLGHVGFRAGPRAIAVALQAQAPASAFPYLEGAVPGMRLSVTALAAGNDFRSIGTRGAIWGDTASQALRARFAIDARGAGAVDPLLVAGSHGSLYARAQVDRPHDRLAAFVQAHRFRVDPSAPVGLPGIDLGSQPPLSATIDGTAFAVQRQSHIEAAGDANVADARFGNFDIASAHAEFGGAPGGIEVSRLAAHGSWGSLDGAATVLLAPGVTTVQLRNADVSQKTIALPPAVVNATVALAGQTVRIYAAHARAAGADLHASGAFGNGGSVAVSADGIDARSIPAGVPLTSGRISAAGRVSGSIAAPRGDVALVANGIAYRTYRAGAQTRASYAGDRLALRDGIVSVQPGVVSIDGTVAGLTAQAIHPRLDLDVGVRSADLHEAALLGAPAIARNLQGSADARLHVSGSATAPQVSGYFSVPEGSYHGLGVRDLSANVDANLAGATLRRGRVTAGSTAIAFDGRATRSGNAAGQVRASSLDLADFDDYFDDDPSLAGRGSANASFALANGLRSSGSIRLRDVAFRRFALEHAAADWHSSGRAIALTADAGGASGRVSLSGRVTPPSDIAFANVSTLATRTDVALRVQARQINVETWANTFGYASPVGGLIDADATASGVYPRVALSADAALTNGFYGRVPIDRLRVSASAVSGRGTIRSAVLQMPSLDASATGNFGLRPSDRLDVIAHILSPDVGALAREIAHRSDDIAGTLDSTVRITGTPGQPEISAAATLSSIRYAKLTIPRATAQVSGNRRFVHVQSAEIDFARGRVLAAGSAPTVLGRNATIAFAFTADDLELANFVPLLPSGTRAAGRIDGRMTLRGTVARPNFGGNLDLAQGSFSGPQERIPITAVVARLAFAGTSIYLQNARANVGGGTFTAGGVIAVPNVRDLASAGANLTLDSNGARIDAPAYYKGNIDAHLALVRALDGGTLLSGTIALDRARVPVSALLGGGTSGTQTSAGPDVAFALSVAIGDDVRVVSPSVDVGGQGSIQVAGTLARPALLGRIIATGGTLDFYRHFRLQRGSLAFDPASGLTPDVNAVATTRVGNPDTTIQLRVRGPANALDIALASDPPYTREQILGLLVGAQQFGAVAGIQANPGTSFSASSAAQQIALGQVNQVFTRSLLQPLSNQIGDVLGLQNFEVYNDIGTGFGASAGRALGRNVSFSAAESFGQERRSSLSIIARLAARSQLRLTVFQTPNQQYLTPYTPQTLPQSSGTTLGQQLEIPNYNVGNGFSFQFQRKF